MLSRIRSMGLTTRIVFVTLMLIGLVVSVNYVVVVRSYRASAEAAMIEKAGAFTAVADAAKNHVARLNQIGVFASEDLMADVASTIEAGKGYDQAKIFGTIPVVAGWSAAEEAATREGIDFYISAFDARNKTNEPEAGSFEESLLKDLTTAVKAGGSDVAHRIDRGTNELHYMRAIRLGAECMMCHGVPGNEYDTDGDGLDPLGFQMESWKVGDMHGAYHVVMPLATVDAQVAQFITTGATWSLSVAGVGLLVFTLLLRRIFGNPIRALIARVRDIAEGEGDLTQRVPVKSNDEIGQLGKWFNKFVQRINDTVYEVGKVSVEVASAATEISSTSDQMASGLEDQSKQIVQISSAIEEMSTSVMEVAQRSSSAADSAKQSGETAKQGGQVVQDTVNGMQLISESVTTTAGVVGRLGDRAQKIGAIVKVINEIADQTNLLALNAAIEAARAGEHGRGFAVVADEVRKLADRTSKATEEIAESVQTIQSETGAAVAQMDGGAEQVQRGVGHATKAGESLKEIVAGAREVASMIESIAAATEEQSAASKEVASRVESVSGVTQQATEGASQAAAAALELSTRAEQLRMLVGRFKTNNSDRQQG